MAAEGGFLQDSSFWVSAAIIVTVGALYPKAARAITAKLDSRAEAIREQIEEARKLREEAQSVLAEYQRKQRSAAEEAEQIVEAAKREAARIREQMEADLERTIERRKQQALDRIAQTEAQAVEEVRNLAVDVALAATEKLIQSELSQEHAAKLVDDSIKDLPGKLH